MSSPTKRFRRLAKAIKPYGLEIKKTKGHNQILKDGKRVYTFAGSPAVVHFAEHNTFHDLKKMGLVPEEDNSI